MNRHQPACAILLVLLLVGAPFAACQQSAPIIGVVRVLRGNFPEPLMVILQVHGATIASAYTDGEGRFSFNAVSNIYHVIINDERYEPVDKIVEIRPDVSPTNILQILLVSRETKAASQAGPYVVSSADLARNYPKNAVKEYERGVKLENEGKADEAIEHYRKAIKEGPNLAVAHNNLGSLLVGKSDFPAAQKELEQSMKLDPSDAKACFNMANLMLLTGRLPDAERYLQDGFRKQPDSAFGFFVQGSVKERTGNYADAERDLKRALQLNPQMARAHLELVNLYLRQQRSSDAIAELRKFLQDAPTDPLAPKVRGVLQRLEAEASPSSRK
ncbi:MAG: tetratricopeptide repeat protein [Acidobacteriia bacterium]|nr:tetratricopeptide repeat protein [Terriglobia bacterium]